MSALGETKSGSRAPAPGLIISRAVPRCNRQEGASVVFRGFRPASLPTATTRDRGRLSLIATKRQEVLGVGGDLDVGQQRLPVHRLRR
jgi:hypothetical protein